MNPHAQGRAKRPLEILELRKHINEVEEELVVHENFRPTDDSTQQYQEYVKGDMLITLEFLDDEMHYYGVIIDGGKTMYKNIIKTKIDYDLFIRNMRKIIRYA